jgi:hypothetical protein
MNKMNKRFTKFDRDIEEMEWLRMATLLDTEGSIQIKKLNCALKRGCRQPNHQLQVTVTNTDPRITLWCKAVFGGSISFRRPPKSHHRCIYRWCAGTARGEAVLIGCLPYFLIKRDQAEVAIASRDTVRNCGVIGHDDATIAKREAARIKLQDLKREEFSETEAHAQVFAQLDPRSTQKK